MKIKKLLCAALAAMAAVPTVSAFAMSTAEFDNGMRNGINYFNRGLYYEARDEFQWFCDYNWGKMNSGQQQYALDYLGAAKQKNTQKYSSYVGKWNWDLSVPYIEGGSDYNFYHYDEAWVHIEYIDPDTRDVRFQYYHQKGGVHLYEYTKGYGKIENDTIIANVKGTKDFVHMLANFEIRLSLGNGYIYLTSINKDYNAVAFEGMMYK